MSNRKSKIVIIQFLLFIISGLIIFTTYFKDNKISEKEIISSIDKEKIKSDNISQDEDVFYNIEYSGLDLSGNRYILKSKEARSKKKTSRDSQYEDCKCYILF